MVLQCQSAYQSTKCLNLRHVESSKKNLNAIIIERRTEKPKSNNYAFKHMFCNYAWKWTLDSLSANLRDYITLCIWLHQCMVKWFSFSPKATNSNWTPQKWTQQIKIRILLVPSIGIWGFRHFFSLSKWFNFPLPFGYFFINCNHSKQLPLLHLNVAWVLQNSTRTGTGLWAFMAVWKLTEGESDFSVIMGWLEIGWDYCNGEDNSIHQQKGFDKHWQWRL